MQKFSIVKVLKEFNCGEKIFKVGHKMKYVTRLKTGVNVLKELDSECWLECSDETLRNFEEVAQ